jgi:small subunit ribosomal protein S2
MVDTNCDPDSVDYVIPSNDDAIRAIDLIVGILAQAVIDGRNIMTEGAISTPMGEEKPEVSENVENQVEEEDINMDAIVQDIEIKDKDEEVAIIEGE